MLRSRVFAGLAALAAIGLVLGGCQLTPNSELEGDVSRPTGAVRRQFDTVWYRSENHGLSLIAFEASGKLVISDERVTFVDQDETLVIDVAEIRSVRFGKLSGDFVNGWAILTYGSPEKVAGFKDGSRLGWGDETSAIYSALRAIVDRESAGPAGGRSEPATRPP